MPRTESNYSKYVPFQTDRACACHTGLNGVQPAFCAAAELFPFVLPWDDATHTVTDVSSLAGFATGRPERLYHGQGRPPFRRRKAAAASSASMSPSARIFPRTTMRRKWPGAWRSLGSIACGSITWTCRARRRHLPRGRADARSRQLDRLDYFIAQLKAHGIYADLNLHVSRTYPDRPEREAGSESVTTRAWTISPLR